MKYYKIKVERNKPYVINEADLKSVLDDLRILEEGTKMTITVEDMSDEDYENLPEYEGP